ncbi:uncharacterized protein [Dysidea avara]|uniref:uncharacterized protein n=1 Tax=Dysidea avara TaxID=196820 RepID=UPI0033279319
MDAYDEENNSEASAEFQTALDQDSEFMDNVVDKVSQLKVLKDEVERKRRELETSHTQNLEQRLTQVQEQMSLLQSSQTHSGESHSSRLQPSLTEPTKLSQFDMPSYAGDPLKWKEFWDMFEASVHKEKRYANIDKFTYLKSKLSGDALEAIGGYQLSNENYLVVIDVLKKRFGNKQVVIDAYYHNLSHLPVATNHVSSLRQCYDAIERNLRSLEAIGQDVNHRHFIALISEKLPQKVLYQLYMLKAEDKEWTVSKFRQLLGKHISAMEMASLEFPQTASQPKHSSGPGSSQSDNSRRNLFTFKSTASGLLAGNNKQYGPRKTQAKCAFCGQPHWSDECSKCITLQERREKLKGSCYICLKRGHMSKNCAKDKICAHCGKKNNHHRSLCPTLFPDSSSSSGLSSIEDTVEFQPKEMTKTNVLMQTATATVKSVQRGSSMPVRLILDSGSQRTYVTDKLTKEIQLNLGPSESLSIATFGASQSTKLQCKSSKLQLYLKDGSFMTVDVTVVPSITGRITRTPLSSADVKFLKESALEDKLADTIVTNAEVFQVDMLVGNDYYFDLLQPRKIDLGNGLFLFQSTLGWIFGGKVASKTEVESEQGLLVGNAGVTPTDINVVTQTMLTLVEPSIAAKPDLELFWNLESLGITESPSTRDDDLALDHFNKTVK